MIVWLWVIYACLRIMAEEKAGGKDLNQGQWWFDSLLYYCFYLSLLVVRNTCREFYVTILGKTRNLQYNLHFSLCTEREYKVITHPFQHLICPSMAVIFQ